MFTPPSSKGLAESRADPREHSKLVEVESALPAASTFPQLPDELLASIFHQLSYDDRIRIERVCGRWQNVVKKHGWSEIRGFNAEDYPVAKDRGRSIFEVVEVSAILSRCGLNLRWLMLGKGGEGVHNSDLQLCLNIQHLRLRDIHIDKVTLELIHQLYGDRLKSLVLRLCNVDELERLSAFNAFLAKSRGMEYLYIRCGEFPPEIDTTTMAPLNYPPTLRNLRLVNYPLATSFLRIQDVASVANLRSLNLQSAITHDYAALRQLPQLIHLSLRLLTGDLIVVKESEVEASLIETLPYLPNLRSLVVKRVPNASSSVPLKLLAAIPSACPELEHFGWRGGKLRIEREEELWALSRLEQLRSLQLSSLQTTEEWDFHWLDAVASRGRLEFLDLRSYWVRPSVLHSVVKKNKALRTLILPRIGSREELEQLAAAAAGAECAHTGPLPLISLLLRRDCMQALELPVRCGRLVLSAFPRIEKKSHVLRRHCYGGLSEGLPEWRTASKYK